MIGETTAMPTPLLFYLFDRMAEGGDRAATTRHPGAGLRRQGVKPHAQ
jgi:hypothetical protein